MNYGTYTATTAQITLLRHMYRYYGTNTATKAHIPLLRHIYPYYGTYTATTAHITVTVPEIPLFTQDLHHITIRTQNLEICGDSFVL